ncbi:XRE family transcriptional regulator [Chitinophaga silvisoli]|uniref:XRE family transcriptional regulator n=1 Tax=Chitinophaga silvisoli TaxID=2291814 RepID=A0A3E1P2M8_9BACT|nr:XRE family transcriptional regulator [Chitinophaga silvisoli]RFM34446.1 XRE family transcriptional regulator [Chitinophaga silvisoli]
MEPLYKLNRIKSLLADKRIKNEVLANYLGYKSVDIISKWNSNKIQPPVSVCYQIALFFKLKDWRDIFEPEPFEILDFKDDIDE